MTNTGINHNNLREKPKGVLLGMFKMDCLALFGRHVLKIDASTIDNLLRQAYSGILTNTTRVDYENVYTTIKQEDDDVVRQNSQRAENKLMMVKLLRD